MWVVAIIYVRFKYVWVTMLITYLVISGLMVFICFPVKNIKKLVEGVLVLYGAAFIFGGILNTIYFNFGLGVLVRNLIWGEYRNITVIIILGFGVMIFICRLIKNYEQQILKRRHTYNVTLIHKDKNVEIKALYDTGNCLREPISKRPVSICTEDVADMLLGEKSEELKHIMECMDSQAFLDEKVYVVPFMSVGNENGLIVAIEIKSMRICIQEKTVEEERPLIGFCKGRINSDLSYSMILNSAVLSNDIE